MIAEVSAPFEMVRHQTIDRFLSEKSALPDRLWRQGILQHGPQGASTPFVRRNIQACFAPVNNRFRKFIFHQTFKDYFLLAAFDLPLLRQTGPEFQNPVIQIGIGGAVIPSSVKVSTS